ncbi:MAG: S41 family peptidase [Planctomycetaceae bacterium]|nr:S41 family peptidase [Planctomycetaceae bacterium]
MSRRNFYLLLVVLAISFACYHKADSANRSHYEPMFDIFKSVMTEIKDHYLFSEDIDERKLFDGAMEGMVEQLDDYSSYDGHEETQRFHETLDQQFGGIGIEIDWNRETKTLSVMSPMVGTPAYEAGILAGDRILKIDDKPVEEFVDSQDAVKLIKGKPGDLVKLTIVHRGETKPIELSIERAIIKVDTVLGDRRLPDGHWDYTLAEDPRIGYIRITQFAERTVDELSEALRQCRAKKVRGLILDVRNNPGGLLDAAYKTCDFFVREGVIVTIRERGGKERERREATGQAEYTEWPMAVLVNHFSASASEIVAACLQDRNRAVVVGERSWGKGTVQSPIELEGGKSLLRLTIASYWRPSDKNIHRKRDAKEADVWGVSPSPGYEVKLDDKQLIEMLKRRRARDVDQQIEKNEASRAGTTSTAPSSVPSEPSGTTPAATATGSARPASEPAGSAQQRKKESSPDSPAIDPQLARAVEYLEEKFSK